MASKADIRKKILELYSIEELKQTGPKKLTARVGEALGAELDKQAVQEIAIEIISASQKGDEDEDDKNDGDEEQEEQGDEAPKKKKRARQPAAPGKPKQGRSAYVIWSGHNREAIKKELAEAGKPTGPTDVLKALGEKWSALSEDAKKPFVEEAKKEKEQQNALIAKWKKENPELAAEPAKKKGGGKAAGGEKKKKDPNRPKRGRTAYIIFSVEERERVKNENPSLGAKELISQLGVEWGALPPARKKHYEDLAAAEKERQDKLIAEYEKEHPELAEEKKTTTRKRERVDEDLEGEELEHQQRIDAFRKLFRECGVTAPRIPKDESRADQVVRFEEAAKRNAIELSWSAAERERVRAQNDSRKELDELSGNKKVFASTKQRRRNEVDYKTVKGEDDELSSSSSHSSVFSAEASD